MRYPLGPHPTNASTGDPAEPTHAADTSVKTPNHTPRNKVADDLIVTTTAGTIRGLRLTIPGPLRTWRGVPYGDTTDSAPPTQHHDGTASKTAPNTVPSPPNPPSPPATASAAAKTASTSTLSAPTTTAPSPSSSTSTAAPSSTDPATNKSSAATTSSKPWTWSMSP